VLSREEPVVSPFDNSGRIFGWLWPIIFPLKLRGFPHKRIGVPVCSFTTAAAVVRPLSLGQRLSWVRRELLS
jgi:hypothetical protein